MCISLTAGAGDIASGISVKCFSAPGFYFLSYYVEIYICWTVTFDDRVGGRTQGDGCGANGACVSVGVRTEAGRYAVGEYRFDTCTWRIA